MAAVLAKAKSCPKKPMRTTVLALLSKSLPPVLTPAAVVRQAYSKEGFEKQSVAARDNAGSEGR
jgi:hypothetical protein